MKEIGNSLGKKDLNKIEKRIIIEIKIDEGIKIKKIERKNMDKGMRMRKSERIEVENEKIRKVRRIDKLRKDMVKDIVGKKLKGINKGIGEIKDIDMMREWREKNIEGREMRY